MAIIARMLKSNRELAKRRAVVTTAFALKNRNRSLKRRRKEQ